MKGGLLLSKKRDAFTAIKRFMCDGDVVLRVEEEAILNRWIFVDALLKAKDDDEESIIEKVSKTHSVSKFTARNDITFAQRLFADARKINKKYLIHLHLQRMDEDIQRVRKSLFTVVRDKETGEETQCIPDAKEMAALAKLNEVYTYTLNSIPEEIETDNQPPPIFHFILAPGQVIDRPMNISEAMDTADAILLTKNKEGVYDMPDEDET